MKHTLRLELAAAAAMAVALPLLAFLQYKWAGDLSRAERERLHATLQQAGLRFTNEFDGELSRTLQLAARRGPRQPPGPGDYADALARAGEAGRLPRLLRGFYLVRDAESAVVDAYDPAAERFTPGPWPPQLARLRTLIVARARGPVIVDPTLPAIAVPQNRLFPRRPFRRTAPEPPEREPEGPPRAAWFVFELDKDYLTAELLPGLAQRYLGTDYVVQVVAANAGDVLYRNRESTPATPPEARFPLGLFRPAPGMAGPPPDLFRTPRAAVWELQLWPRAGSLDQIVGAARARNLAVSGAILLLMAGGFVLLIRSARQHRELARLQMDFVAGVSHELRTPLAVIRSAGENLADGLVTREEQIRGYGALIRGEGRRLSQMVEQVLRFAGLQAGREKYEFSAVAVAPLINAAAAAYNDDYRRAARTLEVCVPTALPPVRADAVAIEQCVRNLIENALKHAAGSTRVEARADHHSVAITVTDHGPGIDYADRPHVFDPFFRGRRALSEQVRGAGLGLSLVKRIVEAHGGTVSVASRPGEGAAFELRLPAAAEGPEGNQR